MDIFPLRMLEVEDQCSNVNEIKLILSLTLPSFRVGPWPFTVVCFCLRSASVAWLSTTICEDGQHICELSEIEIEKSTKLEFSERSR